MWTSVTITCTIFRKDPGQSALIFISKRYPVWKQILHVIKTINCPTHLVMASPIPETTASLLPKIPFWQILWSKKVKIGGGSYAQVFEVKHNLESPCAAKNLLFPHPSTNNSESNAVMKSNFFRLCDLWSSTSPQRRAISRDLLSFGRRNRIAEHDLRKDARQCDITTKRTR